MSPASTNRVEPQAAHRAVQWEESGRLRAWDLSTLRDRAWPVVLSVFVIALGLRVTYLAANAPTFADWPDSRHIEQIAWRLSQGLSYDDPADPLPAIFRPPLLPLLISGVYRMAGRSPVAAQYCLALLSSLGAMAVCYSAMRLYGRQAGLAAGLLYAIYPYYLYLVGVFYPEAVGVPLVATCVLVFLINVQAERMSSRWMALLGVLMGLAALCRANWLVTLPLLLPCVYICRWLGKRECRYWPAAITGCLWLVTWLPWTLRNAVTYDGPILISANGGYNFYLGNAPDATYNSKTAVQKPYVPRDLDPYTADRIMYQMGWQQVKQRPARTLVLSIEKFLYMWQPVPAITNHPIGRQQFLVAMLSDGLVLLAGLAGVVLSIRRRSWEVPLLLGIAVVDSAMASLFIAPQRLRLPFETVLLMAAGLALVQLRCVMSRRHTMGRA